MKHVLYLAGLIFTLIFLSYIESPYSLINEKYARISSIPNEVAFAEVSGEQTEDVKEEGTEEIEEIPAQNFVLEMILEDKSEEDGYIVETYREYEIYKDENGQVIKKVPTSNYDYLRYKK